ncbi:group II intron maturase-specific domain-containing protein [Pasteuria penetrans]|uniref:group II intron maturase-specific domain-containing protein n=1 Tax=Pasteuria penetrans TaxID=86005 RepID=UPI000FB11097|nr:group II intron maturase-specific domain-containing protein [Pasteuria penetrans]
MSKTVKKDDLSSLSTWRSWLYRQAKRDPQWRASDLLPMVAHREVLWAAFQWVERDCSLPGSDGVTGRQWKQRGTERVIELQRRLLTDRYRPHSFHHIPSSKRERTLSQMMEPRRMPPFCDRVVQTSLRLILEPIWEATFPPGSYQDRPGYWPPQAVEILARAITRRKTKVWILDVHPWLNCLPHDYILACLRQRINDVRIIRLIKQLLQRHFQEGKGISGRGNLFPFVVNILLSPLDAALEAMRCSVCEHPHNRLQYARCGTEIAVLVDGHPRWRGLMAEVQKKIWGILDSPLALSTFPIQQCNLECPGSCCIFADSQLRCLVKKNSYISYRTPSQAARSRLLDRLGTVFRQHRNQPIARVIGQINPILQDFVSYFRAGNSSRCFHYIAHWVDQRVRQHMIHSERREGLGLGWQNMSRFRRDLGLYHDYLIRRPIGDPPLPLPLPPLE